MSERPADIQQGELLSMQVGTNEMIAHKMYTTFSTAGKSHLHYFFYIGKGQTYHIVAKKKKRDCHVEVMIVDEHIGIQGNGNQDAQSWFHSQEINVMFNSALVCKAWIDGLRRNQNTHIYGRLVRRMAFGGMSRAIRRVILLVLIRDGLVGRRSLWALLIGLEVRAIFDYESWIYMGV
jgi:hypothetical protein